MLRMRRYGGSIMVIGVQLFVREGDEEMVVVDGMRVVCRVEWLDLAELLNNDRYM